jgi:hypothetical protein
MIVNPDPNGHRIAMAEGLAENPPNASWAYTEKSVVMFAGLLVSLFDAVTAGRSSDFETEAALRQLRARPATPPTSAHIRLAGCARRPARFFALAVGVERFQPRRKRDLRIDDEQ